MNSLFYVFQTCDIDWFNLAFGTVNVKKKMSRAVSEKESTCWDTSLKKICIEILYYSLWIFVPHILFYKASHVAIKA